MIEQVFEVPLHAPDQPVKTAPKAGAAVNVATSPVTYPAVQAEPQLMRLSDDDTPPLPTFITLIDGTFTFAAVICALMSAPTSPSAGSEQLETAQTA
jgi:hypothetical protein